MKILFMCVANSARSQLAEGLARDLFKADNEIYSAGSKPAHVNPMAIAALNECGIDIRTHRSKSIDELPQKFIKNLDFVITLCAEEVCPIIISSAKKIPWPHSDPAGKGGTPEQELQRFRQVRNQIREKLVSFGALHNLLKEG